jgi:putative two-component system response regulator
MPTFDTLPLDPAKATILVVDDGPYNHELISEILRDRYNLVFALSGERALEIARGPRPPDCVLLDVMMPGLDGYDVCRLLKADEKTRPIPVIFITAMQEIEDETKGFEVGCVDFIIKPISAVIVQARVATHVKLYRQERALMALVRDAGIGGP